jgi:hypothetical protein
MNKKDAPTVGQLPLNVMEGLRYGNSDFNVCGVNGHLYGNYHPTVPCDVSTGSDYGLQRVVLSDCCAKFLVTVLLNLNVSKVTGLNKHLQNKSTIPVFGTWFTMRPIFIRMGVS